MKSDLKQQLVLLKGNKCALCGYNKNLSGLHFHHVNPFEKSFNIAEKSKISKELLEELNKCILVCSNCHTQCHDGSIDIEYLAELLFDSQIEI